eukprot:scaffold8126_cov170-Amphora_coffeaeformis.AAC.19
MFAKYLAPRFEAHLPDDFVSEQAHSLPSEGGHDFERADGAVATSPHTILLSQANSIIGLSVLDTFNSSLSSEMMPLA